MISIHRNITVIREQEIWYPEFVLLSCIETPLNNWAPVQPATFSRKPVLESRILQQLWVWPHLSCRRTLMSSSYPLVLMNLFGNRSGFSKPRRGEGRREPTFDVIEEPAILLQPALPFKNSSLPSGGGNARGASPWPPLLFPFFSKDFRFNGIRSFHETVRA